MDMHEKEWRDLIEMIKSLVFITALTVIICFSLTHKNGEGGGDRENNIFLKGLCAILIMLHHAVSIFGTTYLWFFKFTGYITTAIFFGLSGYGLTVQLQQDKYRDIRLFQKKRLKTILIPFTLACVIYLFVYKSLGIDIDFKSWLVVGQPIHQNFWYIIALFYLYEVFAIVYLKYKKRNSGIIWIGISLILYIVLILLAGYGSHWYNSAFAFIVGIFWGLHPNIKAKVWHILSTLVAFGTSFLLKIIGDYIGYQIISVVFACISSVCFFLLYICFFQSFNVEKTNYLEYVYLWEKYLMNYIYIMALFSYAYKKIWIW